MTWHHNPEDLDLKRSKISHNPSTDTMHFLQVVAEPEDKNTQSGTTSLCLLQCFCSEV